MGPTEECKLCERFFLTKKLLNLHKNIHVKEKQYECKTCNKKFRQKRGLYTHEKIHLGLNTYPCKFCEKKFGTRSWKNQMQKPKKFILVKIFLIVKYVASLLVSQVWEHTKEFIQVRNHMHVALVGNVFFVKMTCSLIGLLIPIKSPMSVNYVEKVITYLRTWEDMKKLTTQFRIQKSAINALLIRNLCRITKKFR